MTLREINTLLRETEIEECALPLDRLVAILSLLRSFEQGDIATIDGVVASVAKFKASYGPVSTESIDEFMELPASVLDREIDNYLILEILAAE